MDVPRLGIQSELQLPATATATATPDPSLDFDLHHRSEQRRILDPLRKARDRTRNFMVRFRCATMGTPQECISELDRRVERAQLGKGLLQQAHA